MSRFGRLTLPPRRARFWRRYPSHGPSSERRRYLTRLGSECEIALRTCVCAGGFTRPTGDLGLQLSRRIDHVETRSPPYVNRHFYRDSPPFRLRQLDDLVLRTSRIRRSEARVHRVQPPPEVVDRRRHRDVRILQPRHDPP